MTSEQAMNCVMILLLFIPSIKVLFLKRISSSLHSVPKRSGFFDAIRGVAICAVLGIHTVVFFEHAHPASAQYMYILYALNDMLRFAIPVFFICSGILLNPADISSNKSIVLFYLRKLLRIGIPYIICSIMYSLYIHESILKSMWDLVTGGSVVTYYFVSVLLQFYLIYPLIVRYRDRWYFLPLTFCITVASYFFEPSWSLLGIPLFFPYLFFFTFGIARRNLYLSSQTKDFMQKGSIAAIVFYMIWITVWPVYFFNMLYVFGVIMFHSLWLMRRVAFVQPLGGMLQRIGRMSLWIYLIHLVPLTIFTRFLLTTTQWYFVNMIGVYILTVVVCIGLGIICRNIYSKYASYLYTSIVSNID